LAFQAKACLIRSGVIGIWSSLVPVASWMTLVITAPMQIIAGSPPPLAGESLASTCTISDDKDKYVKG